MSGGPIEPDEDAAAADRFGRNMAIAFVILLVLGAIWLVSTDDKPGASFQQPCGMFPTADCQ